MQRVEAALATRVIRATPLSGGCVAEVYRADLADNRPIVVKIGAADGSSRLDREGFMLTYLAQRSALPVPRVLHVDPALLVMEWIEAGAAIDAAAEEHAAHLLAALHDIQPEDGRGRYGLHQDTLIGPLEQLNEWSDSWAAFFRDRRLLAMAAEAHRAGQLPAATMRRIEALAARLTEILREPSAPSLIHGDIWSGNVLCAPGPDGGNRIAAFIDPSVYYADAEMELAFITLFSTFGERFFDCYRNLRPLDDEFFHLRRDLYNLYPLLVHTRLFGGGYASQVDATLRRLGF